MIDLYKKNPELYNVQHQIEQVIEVLIEAYSNNKKILICGNGGNAADADHIVGELVKGFIEKREISELDKIHFQNIIDEETMEKLQYGLPAIALTNNNALSYAISNDTGAEMVFAQQVFVYGEEGDVLLTMSTSGNSKNVHKACQVAKAKGIKIVSLLGRDGGIIGSESDYSVIIKENETYRIQEYMLPIYHYICARLESYFFGEE